MYIANLNGVYDAIFNLGFNCQGVYYTKAHGLSCGNGPTDWFGVHELSKLVRLIDNRYQGYMELEDLKIIGTDKQYYAVFNEKSNVASYHDFLQGYTLEQSYGQFRAKIDRRINRFYKKLAVSNYALFIRASFFQDEVNYLEQLVNVLSKYCKGNFDVVFIELNENVNEIVDVGTNINKVCYLQFPRGANWLGCEAAWNYLLNRITLV
jgi:hypothetical protein